KGQNPLHDQHRRRLNVEGAVAAVVVGVVVDGAVDGLARPQGFQVFDQKVVVEGVGVVVVQLAPLLKGQVIVPLVVAVVGDQPDLVLPEPLFQPEGQGGLAAARTACDA